MATWAIIDSIIDELEAAYQLAKVQDKPQAMIAATMAKAKLHGLLEKHKKAKDNIQMFLAK